MLPTVMTRMFVATVLLVYARAAAIDVTCNGQVADDTPRLIAAIHGSSIGDRLYIHGTCVVNDTIPLLGDRAYVGDSRSGTSRRTHIPQHSLPLLLTPCSIFFGAQERQSRRQPEATSLLLLRQMAICSTPHGPTIQWSWRI